MYLLSLWLYRIGNLLAYVAALFVASVRKLSRARGTDARAHDSKFPRRRIESAIAIFKASYFLFYFTLSSCFLFFFLASVCEAQIRLSFNLLCIFFQNLNFLYLPIYKISKHNCFPR